MFLLIRQKGEMKKKNYHKMLQWQQLFLEINCELPFLRRCTKTPASTHDYHQLNVFSALMMFALKIG